MRDLITSIEAEYRRYKTLGEGAMDQLADSQLAQVAGSGNSIVTIVWHLRSEEHTSELQSLAYLVCRLLLEKKKHTRPVPFCFQSFRPAPEPSHQVFVAGVPARRLGRTS